MVLGNFIHQDIKATLEQLKKSRSFIASEENIQDLKHPPTLKERLERKERKQSEGKDHKKEQNNTWCISSKHKITTEAAGIIMNDNNKTEMIYHDDCGSDSINEL